MRYEYDSRGRYTVKGFAKFCRWDELLTEKERMIDEWNPFKWKSYYRDIETGYYYMNGRYYDPEAGLYIDAEDIEHLPANAVTAGGLDRNAITLDNHINIAYNDDNIFTSSELYADVTYDPDENRSWWEKHWLEFVQWALFAIAVAASLVLAACGQPQMLVLCLKSAFIAAMTYAVIVGMVTAISGGNENDMAIAMRRAMIDGFRDAFTVTAICYSISAATKAISAKQNTAKAKGTAGEAKNSADDVLDWDSVVKKSETRYEHVMKHGSPNPNKPVHSVFAGDPIATTNKAWSMRSGVSPILDRGASVYNIPFANAGIAGENGVRIVTIVNTNKLITAYPIFL